MLLTRLETGWAWRVTPPHGPPTCGEEATLETARRTAAFAEAAIASLGRARDRRF
jgi:hypothetical protein